MKSAAKVHKRRLPPIDRRRYRRTLRFFTGVVMGLVLWELVLRRILGPRWVRKNRPKRLRRYAHDFRALAVEMGGVLIKLGQFFSARVDILPVEITNELTGLQDEVPPADFEAVRPIIESEIGPIDQTFAWLDKRAHAAASLGQVYRGRLHDNERVVLKVQRPGIRDLVATDLAALDVVAGWAMRFGPIRRRADVPELLDEFAATLWQELDYVAEADNARRFGEMFAEDPGVYVPAVYPELSSVRVLTLEDVTCIKITDHDAIDAAGVDREQVALRLFRLYMTQIFEHRFFHADPHPGNLFVYPLPHENEDTGTREGSRPFYLVFVDFGMVGQVTDNVLAGLREGLLAVGTRDMRRLVKAYQIMGVLLPHADVDRIARAEQKIFDRVWGMNMRQMVGIGYQEMREFAREFSDILYEMPFQVPQNIIYVGRAVGILSGMCTGLYAEFNPWTAIAPYARELVDEELRLKSGTVLEQIFRLVRLLLEIPRFAEAVLERLERHEPTIPAALDREAVKHRRRARAIEQAATAVVFAALVGAGTVLLLNDERGLGLIGYGLACVSFLVYFLRGAQPG